MDMSHVRKPGLSMDGGPTLFIIQKYDASCFSLWRLIALEEKLFAEENVATYQENPSFWSFFIQNRVLDLRFGNIFLMYAYKSTGASIGKVFTNFDGKKILLDADGKLSCHFTVSGLNSINELDC